MNSDADRRRGNLSLTKTSTRLAGYCERSRGQLMNWGSVAIWMQAAGSFKTGKHWALTWYRPDFHSGTGSLRFPLLALYSFTWYQLKVSYLSESNRCEFTLVTVPERDFHSRTKPHPMSCKRGTTFRSGLTWNYSPWSRHSRKMSAHARHAWAILRGEMAAFLKFPLFVFVSRG